MDALSLTASIVSVATVATQSIQFLTNTIEKVKDAPNILKSVTTDLQAIHLVLKSLNRLLEDDPSQLIQNVQIKYAVENCSRACNKFQVQVKDWMKHSQEDKMFWMDRWKVGLFGLERVKTFRAQLSDSKSTLSVGLNTITILTTSRQEHVMEEMKKMMLQQNEVLIQQKITQADTEAAETQSAVHELMMTTDEHQDSVARQSRVELIRELETQQATNKVLVDMCEEAFSATTQARTGQKIKGLKATNNSSALAGFINTSSDGWNIDQDISEIHADNWSTALAGVMENVHRFQQSGLQESVRKWLYEFLYVALQGMDALDHAAKRCSSGVRNYMMG